MVVLTSFTEPTDGIRHRQPNTTVYVNDNNLGKGTLYIAESRLSWICDSGNGFSVEYPHISLHAISRDLTAFPQECLFLMLDAAVGDEEMNNGDEDDNEENEDDESRTTEMRLVPDDRGMLDAMFHAMNACQALHPDPEDSFSDEAFYEDDDEDDDGGAVPMEETDSRMASLTIENMDSRVGRVGMGNMALEEDRVGVGSMALEENIHGHRVGLGNSVFGGSMGVDSMDSELVGPAYRELHNDRSSSEGNMLQNRMAQGPAHDTDLEDSMAFEDVEY